MKDMSKQIQGAHPHTRGRMTTTAINGSFRGGFKNVVAPISRMSIPWRIARRKFRAIVVVRVFFFLLFSPHACAWVRKMKLEREPGSPLRTGGYQRRKRTRRDRCMMLGRGGHLKSRVATQLLSRASKHRARTNTRIAADMLARRAIK